MSKEPTLLLAHTVGPELSSEVVPLLETRLPAGTVKNAETPDETEAMLPEADVLGVGRFEEEWLERAKNLQLLQTLWAGVDLYPLEAIEDAGVALANASGVHAKPIAEHVLGYMLQFERGLIDALDNQRRGVWEVVDAGELETKTVGIIGVGSIGSRVAELTTAFGMETIGTKRDVSTAPDTLDEVVPAEEYHELLKRADYLVLSCPLTDETEGMLGYDEFRILDSDAVVINVARGEVIDQQALVRALQYRTIRGAALDVFEEEPVPPESVLWKLSNVVITPHMAWKTSQTAHRWAELLEQNYDAVTGGDEASIVNRII